MLRMLRAVGLGIREGLLTLAAAGGVICIVLVVLAFTGGFSLMMFKTGSMAPTIPAGSVALVQEIPAAQIVVGDIVTVAREDELPVTHRVTSVASADDRDARERQHQSASPIMSCSAQAMPRISSSVPIVIRNALASP